MWVRAAQIASILAAAGTLAFAVPADAQIRPSFEASFQHAEPDAPLAAEMLGEEDSVRVTRATDANVPGWIVSGPDGTPRGYIGSSWEIARTTGYSGRPIDMLVAVDTAGHVAGARLMQHAEPILTLGISNADIARFVSGFAGTDLADPAANAASPDGLDIISRATVSTGVIRDAILRVGRTLALAHGVIDAGRIDRVSFAEKSWQVLEEEGALAHLEVTMHAAAEALAGAKNPPSATDGTFHELWVALVDPPTIGQNILGEQQYTRAAGSLGTGEVALFIASRGLHSHRGTNWRRSDVFDRITVEQNGQVIPLTTDGYQRIDKLPLADTPDLKERSVFHLGGAGFDPVAPFRIVVRASRPAADGGPDVSLAMSVDYVLPETYVLAPPPEPAPLWEEIWDRKRLSVAGVAVMLIVLTTLLFLQESLVRRPALWRGVRIGFLSVTLLWLGWGINGQLSVVQVVAFLQSLLSGFRWETFLIEPVIFILWSFTALGLLFWGRGVYCGWLCPFGALQELTNTVARRFGVVQIAVPHALHERLWVIKYTLFIAILALSFYSMTDALVLAEVEPFKTAISLRMMRAWPFVLFVIVLLAAGLFIERFYCRYLCPLGAALAIPAKLKIFDWLRRRPQCGRECRLCEPKCTVGAIDPLGRINPNECVLCLRCQVIFHDANTCPTLKRRARTAAAAPAPRADSVAANRGS